ncbi:MAG TPA: copper chaperone PCu(A)C [Sphingomicrobium sp.]|nr:copper chaperone PCu(A)C [Sphingomicrobium sp.]
MTRLWQPFLLSLAACAQPSSAPQIEATDAWARATAPGQSTGAVYVTLRNRGKSDDALIGASTDRAKTAMLHVGSMDNGISSMRTAHEIEIPPDQTVELKPGGAHIMLEGGPPHMRGEQFDLQLRFDSGKLLTVRVNVIEPGSR